MWKILKNSVVSCMGTLCTLITLTQFFLGTQTYSELIEKYDYLPKTILEIYTKNICLMIFVVVVILQLNVYKNKSIKNKKAGEYIHMFYDNIRDCFFKIQQKNEQSSNNNRGDNFYSAYDTCKELCEKIYLFFKEKFDMDFSVCIKLIKTEEKKHLNNIHTYTLCRVGKDKDKRKENAKKININATTEEEIFVPVSENTAFDSILNNESDAEQPSIFACSNLIMLSILGNILKKYKYKNPNKFYWKYYMSTIVVPIRINNRCLCAKEKTGQHYMTLGFLCVDYKWTISKALKNELSEYCKAFADSMFAYMYEVRLRDIYLDEKQG